MKKSLTILSLIISLAISISGPAQTLIAKWTFPTGNPSDSLADGGLPANLAKAIRTEGGTSTIDFTKNGLTTKAAQATGWDNGAMTKGWSIEITTLSYENLKISSKEQSGGNNPGPRDFSVQYRIGAGGVWTDVPNAVIVTANNWTTGVVDSVPLPDSCDNRSSLFLRWLMTTDTSTTGGIVASTGIDKIDDIYITGKLISTGITETEKTDECRIFPNPSHGELTIDAPEPIVEISLLNQLGLCVQKQSITGEHKVSINIKTHAAGAYLFKIQFQSGKFTTQKVILF